MAFCSVNGGSRIGAFWSKPWLSEARVTIIISFEKKARNASFLNKYFEK
jgi:hypothetical protein